MEEFILVFKDLIQIISFLLSIWWIYTPILLYFLFIYVFKEYTHSKYTSSLEWTLLEIKGPKEAKQGPKAMEVVFTALHGIQEPPRWQKAFFYGEVQAWYSFEIVGKDKGIHFYIRTLKKFKNLVESHLYAQYPNSEITEVLEDHISVLPPVFKENGYDIFGTEYILAKEDAYPIRTYVQFEELNPGREPEDIRRIDPLASITEILASLNPNEYIGIQILASPTGDDWVKKGQEVIDKILGKTPKPQATFMSQVISFIDTLIPGGVNPTESPKEEKKKDQTPGQYEILKAVEASLSKFGYEVGIRIIYGAPKDVFQRARMSEIGGAFKQFNTYNLNGFKWNMKAATLARWPFKTWKVFLKKKMLLENYRERSFLGIQKRMILNVEELATVFHFPDFSVKTPLIPRIEAKKGEPPVELPIAR